MTWFCGLMLLMKKSIKTSAIADISTTNYGDVEDGDAVSAWKDVNVQLVRKVEALAVTNDSYRPTYEEDGINGLPSVYFNGDFLQSTDQIPLTAGDDSYTLIIAFQATALVGSGDIMFAQITAAESGTNNTAGVYRRSGFGYWSANNEYVPMTLNDYKPHITIIKVNNAQSNNISVYLDSNSPTTGATSNPAGANLSADKFIIGTYATANTNYTFDGYISEIIIYDRDLKTSEIESVNAYLSKKYNILLS